MTRTIPLALALAALVCSGIVPAQARKKADPDAAKLAKASEKKKETVAGKPVQVATFGQWGAYLAEGKNKTCYALASPKERKPDVKHETAFVFIADRPAEKVHNEVSIIMGFPVKESGATQAKIGKASFDLVAKGANAWIKNPEDEAKFVEALQHNATLIVRAAPMKGPPTVDSYTARGPEAGARPRDEGLQEETRADKAPLSSPPRRKKESRILFDGRELTHSRTRPSPNRAQEARRCCAGG